MADSSALRTQYRSIQESDRTPMPGEREMVRSVNYAIEAPVERANALVPARQLRAAAISSDVLDSRATNER